MLYGQRIDSAGDERAAERCDQSCRMKTDLIELAFCHLTQACRCLNTHDVGFDHVASGSSGLSGKSESSRKAARGDVNDTLQMRVIEIEPMYQ